MTRRTGFGARVREIGKQRVASIATQPSSSQELSAARDPSPSGSTDNKEGQRKVNRLLTRREVEFRVGLGRSTIYRLMQTGKFPRPLRIGSRAVRWPANELDAWIATQPRSNGDRDQ